MNRPAVIVIALAGLLGGLGFSMHRSPAPEPVDRVLSMETAGTDVPDSAAAVGKAQVEQRLSEVKRSVPEFELRDTNDTPWTAASLEGRPWVINFWATWCPPCIEEIPSMNAAYRVLEPEGIGMLAINAGEGEEAVSAFLDKVAIDFPGVLGGANTLTNWSIKALPTTIVIDAEGNVVYEALGPREWDDEKLLRRVIDLL